MVPMTETQRTEVTERVCLFLDAAAARSALTVDQVCAVLETHGDRPGDGKGELYDSIAVIADELLRRRRYTRSKVDKFYVDARNGRSGEKAFIGGIDALIKHGYPPEAVASLSDDVSRRFLGLGNVWRGVEGLGNTRVLDVGCGSGTDLGLAWFLSGGTAQLVGLDSRPDLLEFAATVSPSLTLTVADVSKLPFAERSFDVVVANGLPPLQRPRSLDLTARELCAVTAPGGQVRTSVLIASSTLVDMLADVFPGRSRSLARRLATFVSGKPTAHDVRAAFNDAGAQVESTTGANPYIDSADRAETAMLEVVASPL